MAQRDRQHLLGGSHLQVERPGQLALEPGNIGIGDVAAVLPQMRGDAVGAGLDRQMRSAQGIGMAAAAGVADGRHVIDVDPEAQMRSGGSRFRSRRHDLSRVREASVGH